MLLRASNTDGMDAPWLLTRRAIAERWHVPPWIVDDAPIDEVLTEIRLADIVAECAKK